MKMSVKIVLFKDPGIIRKAVDHLFYSIEETPDRYFLMQVNSVADPEHFLVRIRGSVPLTNGSVSGSWYFRQ